MPNTNESKSPCCGASLIHFNGAYSCYRCHKTVEVQNAASTSANEPKMPEVIMVEPETFNTCSLEDFKEEIKRNDLPDWVSYTKTDKVEELKEELRELRKDKKRLEFMHRVSWLNGIDPRDITECDDIRKRIDGFMKLQKP